MDAIRARVLDVCALGAIAVLVLVVARPAPPHTDCEAERERANRSAQLVRRIDEIQNQLDDIDRRITSALAYHEHIAYECDRQRAMDRLRELQQQQVRIQQQNDERRRVGRVHHVHMGEP